MKKLILFSIIITISFAASAQQKMAQAVPADSKVWGYINSEGTFVIDAQYRKCFPFSEGVALIHDKKAKSFFILKPDGTKIKPEVANFGLPFFGEHIFQEGLLAIELEGKWGYLNTEGKLAIPAQYDKAYNFDGGVALAEKNERFYLLKRDGTEQAIEIPGLENVKPFTEGFALVEINGLMGVINSKGEKVVDPLYASMGYVSEGMAWVKNDAGKVGFVDAKGNLVVDFVYDMAKNFSDGMALVKKGEQEMFIDKTGKAMVPSVAEGYGEFKEGLAFAKKDGKVGFVGKDGTWKIEPKYDKVYDFSGGLAAVRVGELWGFIDTKGTLVIQPIFERVKPFATL